MLVSRCVAGGSRRCADSAAERYHSLPQRSCAGITEFHMAGFLPIVDETLDWRGPSAHRLLILKGRLLFAL